MAYGYMGKVLWVDLTAGTWEEQEIEEEMIQQYLTGYGLAAKLIFDRTKAGIDPLGPENILGFASGLLTGSSAFFSGRYMVVGKSPLTGGWGDANSGGTLAPEIKKCGYDVIFFTGASKKPVYFLMEGGKISLEDASEMWGKDAFEIEEAIWDKRSNKKLKVATIGQGGQNLSLMSGIVNDKGRIAARSGMGAVMGSKKLIAVALKGKKKVEVADRSEMKLLNKRFNEWLESESLLYPQKPLLGKVLGLAGRFTWKFRIFLRDDALAWRQILKRYGTMGVTAMSAANGDSPIKNWAGTGFRDFPPHKSRNISDEVVLKYQQKRYGCIFCPVKCGGLHKVDEGPYPMEWTHKPEYETLCMLGSLLLIDDLFAIYKANEQCNAYGLDSISTGSAIAFAMEAYEKGLITKEDTGGLELRWGNAKAMLEMIEKIAHRKDIGDVLADGVKKAAEKIGKGAADFAIHAGGGELPAHDPRFDPGFAVTYAAEPTPGRHTITSLGFAELQEVDARFMGKKPLLSRKSNRYRTTGKGKLLQLGSTLTQVGNGAGLCLFGLQMGEPMPIFKYLNATTGWSWSDEKWMAAGERIQNIRHAFNVREGITIEQTKCTPRAVGRPALGEGPNAGMTIDEDTMIREYYEEYGWEYPSGKP
ncbi:MAG: aldehyde ferredoxin oxidoreductase family protein, partial [Proteobacteria bacterium]|nr:aldehyde ferredoxin oxidoreductase family protein [Pseudomonadota bacterium]